jgi:hypothetical protein
LGDGVAVGQRAARLAPPQQGGDVGAGLLVVSGEVEQGAGVAAFGDRVVAAREAGAAQLSARLAGQGG